MFCMYEDQSTYLLSFDCKEPASDNPVDDVPDNAPPEVSGPKLPEL